MNAFVSAINPYAARCDGPERTDDLGIRSRSVYGEKAADLDSEKDERIQEEGGEQSAAQVRNLADRARVNELIHPRVHVPRGCLACYGRGNQQPDLAAEHCHCRNDEW